MDKREAEIIERINEDLRLQKNDAKKYELKDLDQKWDSLVSSEPGKFINSDYEIKPDVLRNFRKLSIFISDAPAFNTHWSHAARYIYGGRRGSIRLLKECLDILQSDTGHMFLEKYPSNAVGNPYIFNYQGYGYTYRWCKHIRFLSVLSDILKSQLQPPFTTLDIGSSYGIFSYLLKKEFSHCNCVLLDFPEQLALAYYFLGLSFPSARIAGYKEIAMADKIDRSFLGKYDFVLIPWFFYRKITPQSIDLITNFASLGEMKRKWFNFYMKSEPFLSAKYFFTVNRFQSAPTYDTDLTILDYQLDDFKKLHFAVSPIFSHTYIRKYLFFYKKLIFNSQYFEFIGERLEEGA